MYTCCLEFNRCKVQVLRVFKSVSVTRAVWIIAKWSCLHSVSLVAAVTHVVQLEWLSLNRFYELFCIFSFNFTIWVSFMQFWCASVVNIFSVKALCDQILPNYIVLCMNWSFGETKLVFVLRIVNFINDLTHRRYSLSVHLYSCLNCLDLSVIVMYCLVQRSTVVVYTIQQLYDAFED